MDGIDLDPASSEVANRTVKAKTYYTKENDGLLQDWVGCVWMNPPYERGLVDVFINRLTKYFSTGDVSQAIVLVNNATDTQWFRNLASAASAIVFITGRISYLNSEGIPENKPLQGQAIAYLGDDPDLFLDEFGNFGWGCKLWK